MKIFLLCATLLATSAPSWATTPHEVDGEDDGTPDSSVSHVSEDFHASETEEIPIGEEILGSPDLNSDPEAAVRSTVLKSADESESHLLEQSGGPEEIRTKTIRNYLKNTDTGARDCTCLDEYLARRDQLVWKVSLTPVTATARTGGFLFGGLAAGATLGKLHSSLDVWAQLGWAISGMLLGGATGATYSMIDGIRGGVHLRQTQNTLKALGELRIEESPGKFSEWLYQDYTRRAGRSPIPREAFFKKLLELDTSGALCNGTLRKQRAKWRMKKLKHRVARPKHIAEWVLHHP